MSQQIDGCVEVKGSFAGKRLPKSVRFFDVRMPDGAEGADADWQVSFFDRAKGETVTYTPKLWSGERAEVALGLKGKDKDFGTTPLHCNTYMNHRTASEIFLGEAVANMRQGLARYLRRMRKAKRNPSTDGGSVLYRPVGLVFANFGWSIVCDNRQKFISTATW